MASTVETINFMQSVICAIAFVLAICYKILHRMEGREEYELQASRQLLRGGAKDLACNNEQGEQEVLDKIRLRQLVDEERRSRMFLRSHIHAIFACVQNRQQPCGCRYTDQRRARDFDVDFLRENHSAHLADFGSYQDFDTASTSSGTSGTTTPFTGGTATPATPVTPVIAVAITLSLLPENRYDSCLSFLQDYFDDELN
ncbi:uncharacterized protein PpBr36_10487 [Pyricularia pennisetigena]|uniref:uncharacterized protein n=1 Tax=Pyricularia pennisetigena TaxID=1578925 RepID=UPI0011522E01|nr:uncharacterized protein PpBr36_10487 [Pyricularia pennisetigena]TLS21114.1 hypothetical protein PpBr36_10487 [Pyricularia pennisetigena]